MIELVNQTEDKRHPEKEIYQVGDILMIVLSGISEVKVSDKIYSIENGLQNLDKK